MRGGYSRVAVSGEGMAAAAVNAENVAFRGMMAPHAARESEFWIHMFFGYERDALNLARDEARAVFEKTGTKPEVMSSDNLSTFTGELGRALRLILEEKEILFFAVLQWLVIAVGYLVWTQVLDWIPDSVWEEVRRKDSGITFTLVNLVLLGWSFLVVAAASYPLSLLNAAITAAHYQRSAGHPSTIAGCLELAYRNLPKLWVFTTIDAWITVNAIVDRMPRRRGTRTALDELLYYTWKIGTMGVVPSLVAGRGFFDAAKESAALLAAKPGRAIGIRMGYSLLCWVIGVLAYLGGLAFVMNFGARVGGPNGVYNFYVLLAVPIVVAVGVTAVLLRPLYLIVVAQLYTEVVPVERHAALSAAGGKSQLVAFVFACLLCALFALYFFGDQLGVRDWIETLAERDLRGAGKPH